MKSKIFSLLFSVALVFSFFVFFPTKVSASCAKNPGVKCNLTNCSTSSGLYCCGSSDECTTLQNGGEVDITDKPVSVPVGNSGGADVHGNCGQNGISTAIGCLSVLDSQESFLGALLSWAVGIGGGIAFLLIVYAGFMIMTASGNPERLKAGQELLTSALSGLILLILSIFILKVIGVDILGLGKLGFSTQ